MVQLTWIVLARAPTAELDRLVDHLRSTKQSVLVVFDSRPLPVSAPAGVQVLFHALNHDYAMQRNWALQHVDTPWACFFDDDEWPSGELLHEVIALSANDALDGILLRRQNSFFGRTLRYGEAGRTWLLRAARVDAGRNGWQRPVHEVWHLSSQRTTRATTALQHQAPSSFAAWLTKLSLYAQQEARSVPRRSRPRLLLELATYPLGKFLYALIVQGVWRDGWPGVFHALAMSHWSICKRVLQWEAWYVRG